MEWPTRLTVIFIGSVLRRSCLKESAFQAVYIPSGRLRPPELPRFPPRILRVRKSDGAEQTCVMAATKHPAEPARCEKTNSSIWKRSEVTSGQVEKIRYNVLDVCRMHDGRLESRRSCQPLTVLLGFTHSFGPGRYKFSSSSSSKEASTSLSGGRRTDPGSSGGLVGETGIMLVDGLACARFLFPVEDISECQAERGRWTGNRMTDSSSFYISSDYGPLNMCRRRCLMKVHSPAPQTRLESGEAANAIARWCHSARMHATRVLREKCMVAQRWQGLIFHCGAVFAIG